MKKDMIEFDFEDVDKWGCENEDGSYNNLGSCLQDCKCCRHSVSDFTDLNSEKGDSKLISIRTKKGTFAVKSELYEEFYFEDWLDASGVDRKDLVSIKYREYSDDLETDAFGKPIKEDKNLVENRTFPEKGVRLLVKGGNDKLLKVWNWLVEHIDKPNVSSPTSGYDSNWIILFKDSRTHQFYYKKGAPENMYWSAVVLPNFHELMKLAKLHPKYKVEKENEKSLPKQIKTAEEANGENKMQIIKREEELTVSGYELGCPGINKENVAVNVDTDKNEVIIERKDEENKTIDQCVLSPERRYDAAKAKVEIADGIVKITIPTKKGVVVNVKVG